MNRMSRDVEYGDEKWLVSVRNLRTTFFLRRDVRVEGEEDWRVK